MANILDLNSDCSDSEDDLDYVPEKGHISEASSDEGSDVDREEEIKYTRKSNDDDVKAEEKPKLTEEEEKKRADELFKKFLDDVEPDVKPVSKNIDSKHSVTPKIDEKKKVTVTEEFEFAGETVKVTKEVDATSATPTKSVVEQTNSTLPNKILGSSKRSGGLSALVGGLGKKQKISVLEKSLLDWKSFKKDEGIEEELDHHNKGKGGYLEQQAFLQRSDLRQFEIEKNLRLSRMTKR